MLGSAVLFLTQACSAPASGGTEGYGITAEPIYGGQLDDDASQNSAVVALVINASATSFELCSGSLIAPNVVLTARHCVSVDITPSVSCDENGASGDGPQLGADVAASSIQVFTGPAPDLQGTPAAVGSAIFHTQADVICNGDLALVVLDAPIANVTPLAVRLGSGVAAGESVRAVGYGENDHGDAPGTRFRKDDVAVLAVGRTLSASMTPLATNEFEVGLSICEGDSGGPAISETSGAIVGIVSRGGSCTDNFGHVFTSLRGFASVFQSAFAMAGGAPVVEATSTDSGAAAGDDASTAASSSGSTDDMAATGGGSTTANDLHGGQGAGCSANGGAPSGEASAWWSALLLSALAPSLLRARRRRRAVRRAS